jgi:aminoglycoside phosphotransferase (APT) family kinase protein
MLFERVGGEPVAIVKVPRLPVFNGRTANEQQVLSWLARTLDTRLRDTVPEPLGLVAYRGLDVAIEYFRPGTPIWRSIRQWRRSLDSKVSDLRAAACWLADFHRQTEISRSPWGVDEATRWVNAPLEAYQHAFGVTAAEQALFARARSYAATLGGTPFPIVWQHRDFKPNHVLRTGRSVAVIDWEGGRAGPALCDLIHFVVHWHAGVRGVSGFSGLSALFFDVHPADDLSRAVNDVIDVYSRALGIDDRVFPVLLLYTCVELVLRRAEQQRLQGQATEDRRAANRNFELVDVLARHADELFTNARVRPCAR